MAITAEGKTKVLENLESELGHIALDNSSGEFYRAPISGSLIDADTLVVEIFLDEGQGNDPAIEAVTLWGWGSTSTPGSGTEFSDNAVDFSKDSSETLTVSAEIQVVEV